MSWMDRLSKAAGQCTSTTRGRQPGPDCPPWMRSDVPLEQRLRLLAPALEQAQGMLAAAERAYTRAMALGEVQEAETLNGIRAQAANELRRIQDAQAEILARVHDTPSLPLFRRS